MSRIFLVENEFHTLTSVTWILEDAGYEVYSAFDGLEAVEKILKLQIEKIELDLIISDIQMPKMTGIELTEFLMNRGVKTPILLMTGYTVGELHLILGDSFFNIKNKILSDSGKYLIEKPSDPNELLDIISKVIDGRNVSRLPGEIKISSNDISYSKLLQF